jgi:hypothetical protein
VAAQETVTISAAATAATMALAGLPTFNPAGGAYGNALTVTLSNNSFGSTIYYTIDSTTPTTNSPVYSEPLMVSSSTTIKAFAGGTGYVPSAIASATFTINTPVAATPTFNPTGGAFSAPQPVSIASATTGAAIYFTTNGSVPSTSSTLYTGPITVSSTETIQAVAVASGYTNSAVGSATYTVNTPVAATPTFSPSGGLFTSPQPVSITSATAGAAIYYTTNGTIPVTSSPLYTGPVTVSSSETVQAIAVASGYTTSLVASATYTITIPVAATPTFSPTAGTFTAPVSVTVSDATAGANVYYTTNGTAPSASSTLYSGPIAVSGTETIQAIAVANGYSNSPVASAAYTINLPQDFTLGLSASSLSVARGQSGTVTASIGPVNGFSQPVSFTCSGLPSGATCSFSPATLAPNGSASGTTTVTISTSATAGLLAGNRPYELAGLAAGLSLLFAGRRFRKLRRIGVLFLLLMAVGSAVSCGTGTFAPPTTSTVSINATSGSLTHAASLSLTVK